MVDIIKRGLPSPKRTVQWTCEEARGGCTSVLKATRDEGALSHKLSGDFLSFRCPVCGLISTFAVSTLA